MQEIIEADDLSLRIKVNLQAIRNLHVRYFFNLT